MPSYKNVHLSLFVVLGCANPQKQSFEDIDVTESINEIRDNDGDAYYSDEDCDDSIASVYPGANEICDNLDNDCDGEIDEGVLNTYYIDADQDGFGSSYSFVEACEAPFGLVLNGGDCNDENPSLNPSATELCDSLDNNCNELIDEDIGVLWYADQDADGFGSEDDTVQNCLKPDGYIDRGGDCNDYDALIFLGADEECDEIDNNCNGEIDETGSNIWYLDFDGDGFGSNEDIIQSCTQPPGYVLNNFDCDDFDSETNPNESELCDGLDNNCNGILDDNAIDSSLWFIDNDNDGFGTIASTKLNCTQPLGYAPSSSDCDDNRFETRPNALEFCNNIDDNCDQQPDNDAVDALVYYDDMDGDGFGDPSNVTRSCAPLSNNLSNKATNNQDCDDTSNTIYPYATEICNGLDDNCNTIIDDSAVDRALFFEDHDEDGFGNPSVFVQECNQPSGFVPQSGDCDDQNNIIYIGAPEICDEIDNNCNGEVDESNTNNWYIDSDGDGFGSNQDIVQTCIQPIGYVDNNFDCDDFDEESNPDTIEICDSKDNDCNGVLDDNAMDSLLWYKDLDGDGFGDAASTKNACTQPLGFSANQEDCDDNRFETRPNALEFCNNIDDNCDQEVDNDAVDQVYFYRDLDGDGYGIALEPVLSCFGEEELVDNSQDCDDGNASIYPFAQEFCNNVDDNCNQLIDEAALDQVLYYLDVDGDGFGGNTFERSCTAPSNYITQSGDCDDNNVAISPNGTEICNAKDDDCNGNVDEGLPTSVWYRDFDVDGYGNIHIPIENCRQLDGYVDIADDCDDTVSTVYPQAPEICDGLDNDCDGESDIGHLGKDEICVATTCLEILDSHPDAGDDFYLIDFSTGPEWTQCDMGSFGGGWTQVFVDNMSPPDAGWSFSQTSNCGTWGEILGGYGVLSGPYSYNGNQNEYQYVPVDLVYSDDIVDNDGDGFSEDDGDCDDGNPNINPNKLETLNDNIDQDCDGFDITTNWVYGQYNGVGSTGNTISTRSIDHDEVWIELDYITIDTWDVGIDLAYVEINGTRIWQKDVDNHNPTTIFGIKCGWYRTSYFRSVRDSRHFVSYILNGNHPSVHVLAGSTLNQNPWDESFGIDDVYVWVR